MKRYNVLQEDYEGEPTEIVLSGWDLKDGAKEVMTVLKEYIGYEEKLIIKSLKKEEIAYALTRFYEEQDARDEGFNYWILYRDEWKRGLGKCTKFIVEWEKENGGSE